MSESPRISEEMALEARKFLESVALGEIDVSGKGSLHRLTAARDLYRFYQAQERFGREKINRLAALDDPSADVRDYANLTDEELNAKVVSIRGRQAG